MNSKHHIDVVSILLLLQQTATFLRCGIRINCNVRRKELPSASFRSVTGSLTPQGLLTLVTCSKTSVVVAEAVIVLRQLLQQNPNFEGSGDVVRRLSVLLLQSFLDPSLEEERGGGRGGENDQGGGNALAVASAARASLAQPGARASIIWTLGEYHQHISGVAPDVLRVLAKAFPELEEEVKMQVRGVRLLCFFSGAGCRFGVRLLWCLPVA